MMYFVLKLLITFIIIFLLYWGAVEFFWEEDKVDDEWHDFVQDVGVKSMAALLIGGIVAVGVMLILMVWKGV